MATDVAGGMSNGTYAQHQGYGGVDQNAYPSYTTSQQPSSQQAPAASTTPAAQTQPQSDISKDEVGWYFVEQYYTTLSRSPEKLYLFYNKRSQFVSGQETDKVAVCVGQRAINDKIKDLDFQDCKVRVTNVDSQASDSNIVIQVIGELSNKGQPHRKFTQTFVLATQTNGYFVLNDIFRFLIDEEDEQEQQDTPAAVAEVAQQNESAYQEPAPAEAEPKTLTSSSDPVAVEHDANEIDQEIQKKLGTQTEETAPAVNGDSAHETSKEEEEVPTAVTEPEPVPAAEEERPVETDLEPEKPADPEPTPEPAPAKPAVKQQQPAAAPKPAVPAAPMSWASRAAAANKGATPAPPASAAAVTPAVPRPTTQAAKTATPPSTANSSAPSTATPTAPAAQRQEAPASDAQDEWNTVVSSHNRQQSRQTNVQPEAPAHRGYIKNVMDTVDAAELKAELEKFGKLQYFDVARQKNCAFVDFETQEGYNKATSTPIEIGGEKLFVEERRIRPGSTPFVPRGQFQGGRGGRGGAGGPRGNFQGAPRGNAGRGRGGFGSGSQRGGRGGAAPAA